MQDGVAGQTVAVVRVMLYDYIFGSTIQTRLLTRGPISGLIITCVPPGVAFEVNFFC